jgi:hypothetical protein
MTPLMFAATADRDSDLVRTVTNLQQLFIGFGPAKHEMTLAQNPGRDDRHGRISVTAAKELGKRWRIFPTYAQVQTGPQLRHRSSHA